MKFATKTDKVLTILYTIVCIFLLIVIGISVYYGLNLIHSASGYINANTTQDGYVVLFDLLAGGTTGSIGLILLALAIIVGIYDFILLLVLIFAYIGYHNYKKKGTIQSIKHNLIVKLIYSGIQTTWLVINTIDNKWNPLYAVLFGIVTILCLYALYTMSKEPVLIENTDF